jgi:hypothetical protein
VKPDVNAFRGVHLLELTNDVPDLQQSVTSLPLRLVGAGCPVMDLALANTDDVRQLGGGQ